MERKNTAKADQFHYVFTELYGDFDLAVRVESFTQAHRYSKAGLMIRETLNADSPHLMFLVFSDNQPRNNNLGAYEMQFRSAAGGDCQAIYPAIKPPVPPEFPAAFPNAWLRVKRSGHQFSAFASTHGKNWSLYAEHVLALAGTAKVGPALTTHNPQVPAKAAFRDIAVRSVNPNSEVARGGLAAADWRPRLSASLPLSALDSGCVGGKPWASNRLAIPSAPTSEFGLMNALNTQSSRFPSFAVPRTSLRSARSVRGRHRQPGLLSQPVGNVEREFAAKELTRETI